LQLKEYIDDTEDLINIKLVGVNMNFNFYDAFFFPIFLLKKKNTRDITSLSYLQGNVQNQLIQFELLLTAATFVATIFAVVTGIFGMNFVASIFDLPSAFNWVLIITGLACVFLYFSFLFYFRYKKVFPS
jgi:magnesium transporter